ncbi:MAG: 1-(5-phosphoribosyl)-5-[(5-phosphoribosylamino)methylideneamino] imidazole-4-carboxamide isomerase [Candidatus Methanoplasma sp.]|jgi:phosphoribosylformimino-5-aminoimidazole carboxamide ribotide isomerase|nr:1-(5-phosphoribosyl)-5-[(5-phosphoribosylamino)methylideneamino] imidazole-4-carboxamide isomerase [Candidatus Methanoplasma sp.]
MIVIPAVDVLDHRVVQLVGGEIGSQKIILPDPFDTAMSWVEKGAPYLHLVDLDGAFGKGNNLDVFKKIIKECGVPVQAGGGIRSNEKVEELISAGADRVILGTRAIREPEWLASVSRKYPGRIVAGMDTRDGRLTLNGWQGPSDVTVGEMFETIKDLPLGGVLNTNVSIEGRMAGIDEAQSSKFIGECPHGVISSGGVTSENDCRILSKLGAAGAVVGLALYTGKIRPWEWDTPWYIGGR